MFYIFWAINLRGCCKLLLSLPACRIVLLYFIIIYKFILIWFLLSILFIIKNLLRDELRILIIKRGSCSFLFFIQIMNILLTITWIRLLLIKLFLFFSGSCWNKIKRTSLVSILFWIWRSLIMLNFYIIVLSKVSELLDETIQFNIIISKKFI